MKKFEFTEITDQVFLNTKIDQLKGLSEQVRQTVEMIQSLDDGNLHDQLTTAREAVGLLDRATHRLDTVHGDWHVITDEERSERITKIARGE